MSHEFLEECTARCLCRAHGQERHRNGRIHSWTYPEYLRPRLRPAAPLTAAAPAPGLTLGFIASSPGYLFDHGWHLTFQLVYLELSQNAYGARCSQVMVCGPMGENGEKGERIPKGTCRTECTMKQSWLLRRQLLSKSGS